MPAQELKEGGLVRDVLPPEQLLPAARALAREIADNTAPVSIALMRQMLWRGQAMQHPMEAHRVESRGICVRGRSDDAKEGVQSFMEKRLPNFKARVSSDMRLSQWWTSPATPESRILEDAMQRPRTVAITGAASGIGRATAALAGERGWRVFSVDRLQGDVHADLATKEGREHMSAQLTALSGACLDAVIACAGVAPPAAAAVPIIQVNYFGAIATLEALRPLLARGEAPGARW